MSIKIYTIDGKRLSEQARIVMDSFETQGQDLYSFIGAFLDGKIPATVDDLVLRAQVFSRRGQAVPCSTNNFAYNTEFGYNTTVAPLTRDDGKEKGYYTSHIVKNTKPEMLLPITGAFVKSSQVALGTQSVSSSSYATIDKLLDRAFGSADKKLKQYIAAHPTAKGVINPYQAISQRLYMGFLEEKPIKKSRLSDLQATTTALFASLLVSKTLNWHDAENERLWDETLLLDFITHLNGCAASGNVDLKAILETGANLAINVIDRMGITLSSIQQKQANVLGTPLQRTPLTVREALFGAKQVEKSLPQYVDTPKVEPMKLVPENASIKSQTDVFKYVTRKSMEKTMKKRICKMISQNLSRARVQRDSDLFKFFQTAYVVLSDGKPIKVRKNSKGKAIDPQTESANEVVGKFMSEFITKPLDSVFGTAKRAKYDSTQTSASAIKSKIARKAYDSIDTSINAAKNPHTAYKQRAAKTLEKNFKDSTQNKE